MGKESKDPIKIAKKQQKKIDKKNNETATDNSLSKNYAKFDNINYDSDSSNSDSLKGKLPIIDSDKNFEYMIQQGISQYMVGKESNIHCGIGTPLTQKEFDQLKEESKVIVNKK